MQSLVACIQFRPEHGEAQRNIDHFSPLLRQAAQREACLVILPEMCLNGYLYQSQAEIAPYAEEAQGPSFQQLSKLCQELGIFLVYGFAQIKDGQLFNSQNLIDPMGRCLATYQKRHLFDADRPWASPGKEPYVSVNTDLGKIGLGICMDLNFPDLTYFHRSHKTDILCLSMHWLEEGLEVTDYWSDRLAGFEGLTIIANSFGEESPVHYCGRSSIFVGGRLLDTAEPEGTQTLTFPLPQRPDFPLHQTKESV